MQDLIFLGYLHFVDASEPDGPEKDEKLLKTVKNYLIGENFKEVTNDD